MHDIRFRNAVLTQGHRLRFEAAQADGLVAVLAVEERLAVLEQQAGVVAHRFVRNGIVGAVVEDDAVLEYLDEGRALMLGGALEHAGHVGEVAVHRAGDEGGAGAQRQGDRAEGSVDAALRCGLGLHAQLGGRRILALGEAVDAVVEQDDLQADVAPHGVDEMVTADGQGIAIAGHHPHRQLGPRQLQAAGNSRRASVDAVHAVGFHVVRKPAGAADAGDEGEVLARNTEGGHQLLHLRQHGVVAAAGAPAHVLVRLEVLLGQRRHCVHFDTPLHNSMMRS